MKLPSLSNRAGMTLIEILFGVAIMGIVSATAISFVRQQELAFSLGSGKMNALQNYRFATETIERNLRTAGSGITSGQPFIVYADTSTLAINANYTSNDPSDVFAVYVDPSAPSGEVGSLTAARRITIPGSSFNYPAVSYMEGAVSSPAETIIFYFSRDTTSARTDDFTLFRQVNDLPAEPVARGLLRIGSEPFFTYQELITGDTIVPRTQWIPRGSLPLRHNVNQHLSPADTGSLARIDRIRSVQVAFASVASVPGMPEQQRPLRRMIRMPNAGQRSLRTCGENPLFTSAVSAAQEAGEARVLVSWQPAFDETSGEADVVRYAIYRREPPSTDWGEPFFSIPAGLGSYQYFDDAVVADVSYQYAVAAQDCTPSMSPLRASATVNVVTP